MVQLDDEARLHAVDVEGLHRSVVALANERTRTRDGAIFLWDEPKRGLGVDFHVVDGVVVTIPDIVLRPRKDGRPNGIALECFRRGEPYLCNDTSSDPNYARYFLEVGSVLAVPIPWQGRPLGVLTVSSKRPHAFHGDDVDELAGIAKTSAKYLRRAQLAKRTRDDTGRPYFIKGLSAEWLEVERRIEQVSATDAPVLVHGESGTGKDLVSRSIHFNSRRANKPYVTVNCAAIPETMLESVLFGHVRGAFTGATNDKLGEFRKADGGTLFLDELGELPLSLQAKVLRAIEQGEITPLGSNKPPERVDVRLVSATNRDLPAMVRQGAFRDDLYFRVGVVPIELPPLRSYKDNLEILAQAMLQQAARKHDKRIVALSRAAMDLLLAYDFPGNVRELKNSLEHAVILSSGTEIEPCDLPRSMQSTHTSTRAGPRSRQGLAELRERWIAPHERKYLAQLLSEHEGRVRDAAAAAGINHVTMYRLMKKHGLTLKRGVA